jgi:L-threonylcarbamoyladenylate synthase
MRTVLTRDANEAAEFIKRGGVVGFPTETVYGLGANVFDERAVTKIFEAKLRPADNPLIAHVSSARQIGQLATEITGSAEKLIDRFFPGPLTIVLPKSERVPTIATAGLDSIGVRMPRSPLARAFIDACGVPLAAPSANLSGRPSPTTWQAVLEDLDGRIDCILQGEPTEIGLESTVVDCAGDVPVVLRVGAVSLEELQAVVPATKIDIRSGQETPRSPGVTHRHYSPRAKVQVYGSSGTGIRSLPLPVLTDRAAFIGLNPPGGKTELDLICSSVDEYAHELFEFFRECDRRGIETIYCEQVDESGIGAALMDRIRRAASGQ